MKAVTIGDLVARLKAVAEEEEQIEEQMEELDGQLTILRIEEMELARTLKAIDRGEMTIEDYNRQIEAEWEELHQRDLLRQRYGKVSRFVKIADWWK